MHLRTLPLVALLASGCHPTSKSSPAAAASASTDASSIVAALAPATTPDAGYGTALTLLADGSNAFGLDVYAAARKGHPNLALSPLSLSLAMTMTWAGARGETAAQIKHVLHAAASLDDILTAETTMLAWVRDPAQTVTLRVANRVFGEKNYAFNPAYLGRTDASFGAPLEPLDFAGAAEESRRTINDWVAEQTDQHIRDLLPPRSITSDARLVIANAIYFLGLWERPFRTNETTPAPFHSSSMATNVPTMHELETLRFAHAADVKVLEIPYAGGMLAMTFVLPDAIDGLDALESRLSPAALAGWTAALAPTRVRVAMPRFEINPSDPLALRGILASLGMPLAFDRSKADFTGIAASPGPDDRLYVGDVFHKAYVKVDESGTEAAAATGVVHKRPTFVLREAPPEEFTADHPFLFFLRDIGSGTILFMGRVSDPGVRLQN